jgi:predicted Zn finger-like uncharacterized protein
MHIQCPSCGTGGNIPDNKIPPAGTKIVCPKCKSSFFVRKQETRENKEQNAVTYYKEGVKLLKGRHIDAAIEKFNMAIQANPQYGEAYRYLGVAYGQKNLWAEASQVLQKAITYKPDDVQSLKNLGVAYLKQKKFAEAEHVLQEALNYVPDDEKARSYLSMATQKKEQQQAPAVSQEPPSQVGTGGDTPSDVIASPPQDKVSIHRDPIRELLDKGVDYLDNAQYNQAIEAFNEVIRLNPNNSDGYFGLGMVHEKRENWAQAIDAYQKALELNPNDSTAKENLKFIKKQQKKFHWKFWKSK